MFEVCVPIIYYQMWSMLDHCVFYYSWFFEFEKEKDEHDVLDTAKAIENCYSCVLLLLIYQMLSSDQYCGQ